METEKVLVWGSISLIALLFLFGIVNKYMIGNKQFIDIKQNFNTAYILCDSNRFERVKIQKWNDYKNSDSVQIILEDGTPIYTHLRNVKLTKEN